MTGSVLAAALHGSDLAKEDFLEFSGNLYHHIARKPLRQLHLIEVFMMTKKVEVIGITSQDLEQVPANWTTGLRHSDCIIIEILCNMLS